MNKRILSILCCLTLLVSGLSGLGVIAETTTDQQACVTGATLTALNSAADTALLPTDDNLIAGMSLLSGSNIKSSGDLVYLHDGLYQGVNQTINYLKNEDGSWSVSDNYVNYDVGTTRYVSHVKAATETELGYAQLGFDLGAVTQVETITIGSTAETNSSSRLATLDRFQEGSDFDGVGTSFSTSTRLHMGTVYISDNAETLYDDANIAFTFDYLGGDISALSSTKAPLAGVYDLDTAKVGQYVGFRFYVAGVDGSSGCSTTINGKTAKWGWWSQVRISELGVFGDKVTVVSDITDGVNEDKIIAPEDNILKNASATATDGKPNDVMYDGILCGVTDGYAWDDAYGYIPSSGSAIIGIDQVIPDTDTNFPGNTNGTPTTWLVEQEKDTYKNKNKCVQYADTLLIMLGTNDAGAASYWEAREPYYVEFYEKVIDAFRAVNPDVEIYVLTAPYTSVDSHYLNLRDGVVPLQKKMAAAWGLPVIDVWEASRHHVEDLNDGDLRSFIDDIDVDKGLCLHPDEEGQAVIAQACFDALTGAENDMYVVKANGGQVRGYEGGVPTGDMALRFSMTLPAAGITSDADYNTQLTADSTITINGTQYPVTGLGAVVGIKEKLDDPQIDLVAGLDKGYAKDIPAKKLYEVKEDSVTFTAVITNVREANYDTDLVARGYVQYRDGDETRYAYGPVITRNVSEVIAAHTMDVLDPTFDTWQGYQRMTFTAGGVECYLVMPDEPAEGNPWIWRTEFFGIIATTDLELLEAGWALGYCKVSNMYGSPASVSIMKQFYDAAVPLVNLDRKVVLEGFSRGGLYAVNYAATYPTTVAGVYLDAPVQDICSWPGYLYDNSGYDSTQVNTYKGLWSSCRSQHGFSTDAEALADRTASPRWKYDKLIENEIPVLLVYGDADNVVLFEENGQHLVDAYTNAGCTDLLKVKCFEGRGHTHGWENEASAHIIANMNK